MQVIPLTINNSNIIPMTPSYTGKTEIHWGKPAKDPKRPAPSRSPSHNHKDGPYNRPSYDDGRCGGFIPSGNPYRNDYTGEVYDQTRSDAYEQWIQNMER